MDQDFNDKFSELEKENREIRDKLEEGNQERIAHDHQGPSLNDQAKKGVLENMLDSIIPGE